MKNLKTHLGIEYVIDNVSHEYIEIEVEVSVENGSNTFYFKCSEKEYELYQDRRLSLKDLCDDFKSIEEWANKTETEYFVKWFNDYCVDNSSYNAFYSVSFSYFEWFSVQLYKSQPIDNGTGIRDFKSVWFENAIGVDEINDLILKLKNK